MSAPAVLVAALALASVLLLLPASPDPRRRLPGPGEPMRDSNTAEKPVLRRLRPLLAGVAAAGGWALVGGRAGIVAGILAGIAAWVALGRGELPAVVRRRERLLEDLPLGVDLLAACLDVGAPPAHALETVARAIDGPVAEELLGLHHRLEIGADPAQVWRSLSDHPQLASLGRALTRAHESGASVSRAVHQLSMELRERQQAEVELRARSIEVKAAAPLGLCLLPAFVLLGVVPMVAGVFGSMQIFG